MRSVTDNTDRRQVSANREIAAGADRVFELIADPSQQPRWDGNDNLAEGPGGQRVHSVGDVFTMTLTQGNVAWLPSEPGHQPPGHLWRWELEPLDATHVRVTHTYDWSGLTDETRFMRARATTEDELRSSLDRLSELAERY